MRCPWLVKTIVQTESTRNNESKRTEHQEFDKCLGAECPFYFKLTMDNGVEHERCERVLTIGGVG